MKSPPTSPDDWIFGAHQGPGLVAAEHLEGETQDEILLYIRDRGVLREEREPCHPFLWLEAETLLEGVPDVARVRRLQGDAPLKVLAEFTTWKALTRALAALKQRTGFTASDPAAPFFVINDEIQQHLMRTGRTFFKGMGFHEVRRLCVDIETFTGEGYEFPNPERESDRILAIGLSDSTGWSRILSAADLGEKAMLEQFVFAVLERDPDIIEGHNVFAFDLDYLAIRAKRHGVKFAIGREGRVPRIRPSRFAAGEHVINYPRMEVFGRSVVDTYFLLQIYDLSTRNLPGFGLKTAARHLGLAAPDRTYIEGPDIGATFLRDPDKVLRYLRDDLAETAALSAFLLPVYFVQAGMLPFSFQDVTVRGNATKIDALLLRAYLYTGAAIPRPDASRAFEGGYTDLFHTGVWREVHHCDVRSLYPSLMLAEHIAPKGDRQGAFLRLLGYLRDLRLKAKDAARHARTAEERDRQQALQTTMKVLINSFYGYLGFERARFNDYDAAEQVTRRGREVLRAMIEAIRAGGGRPIEIDTDGVYFTPPPEAAAAPAALERFRDGVRASLPPGIEVEFDGEYPAMFSYRMKNYALLEIDGLVVLKGAALKSRGLEPYLRDFVRDVVECRLHGRDAELPALIGRYRQAILRREWSIHKLARTERLQEATSSYAQKQAQGKRGRNAAYELAMASGRTYRAGDTIAYYVTGERKSVAIHANARLVSEWNPKKRDENVAYYLARLDDLAAKLAGDGDGNAPAPGPAVVPRPDDGQGMLNL